MKHIKGVELPRYWKITFDTLEKFDIPYDELYLENHMLIFI